MSPSRRDVLRIGISASAAALMPNAQASLWPSPAHARQVNSLSALWWDWEPWNEAAAGIWARFQKESGSAVELELTPYEDLDRSVRATGQDPNPPDIMLPDGPNVRTYAVNGLLRPLDDVFTLQEREDFFPVPRVDGVWNEQLFGVAMDESSQAIYFNRAIVDKYDVVPPTTLDEAWTWPVARDIFIEIQAKEREARGTDQFWALNLGAFGEPLGGRTYHGAPVARSNGEPGSPTFEAISADGLVTDGYINTPEAIEALQFLQDLYVSDAVISSTTATDLFANETVAFWLSNMSNRYYMQEVNPSLEWGVTPRPYFKTPISHGGSFAAVVSAYSPNGDLAAQAVKFLANLENGVVMARAARDMPLRMSALPQFPEYLDQPLKVFSDTTAQWARPRPLTPGYSEFDAIYGRALTDIATGASVQETMDAAAQEIDRQLDRYRSLIEATPVGQ